MIKYKPYFKLTEEEEWSSIELEEAFFGLDKKKALNFINKLCKRFNSSYQMLQMHSGNGMGGIVSLRMLFPDNSKTMLSIRIDDDVAEVIANTHPNEYFPFTDDFKLHLKDFLTRLEVVCKYCYDRVYKNLRNNLDMVNYKKLRIM